MRQNVQKNEAADLAKRLPERREKKLRELSPDMQLLVQTHMPLAYAMAWRLRGCGVSQEDLLQEGCAGLCEAAQRYDENADCTFASYASYWCRKMMLLAIRRKQRMPACEPIEARQEAEDEDLLRSGQLRRIDEALACLNPCEQEIIALYYGIDRERLSLTKIAAAMGISKQRACNLHRNALEKLEAELTRRPLVDYLTPWLELQ